MVVVVFVVAVVVVVVEAVDVVEVATVVVGEEDAAVTGGGLADGFPPPLIDGDGIVGRSDAGAGGAEEPPTTGRPPDPGGLTMVSVAVP